MVEKLLPEAGFRVEERSLKYQYPNLKPKIIDTDYRDFLCVGCRGQLAIEVLDSDGPRNSMKMKIEEIKGDKMLADEGIYQEPLSWNEFRLWVLANPEILDDWFDHTYGLTARYQVRPEDDTIEWQGEMD